MLETLPPSLDENASRMRWGYASEMVPTCWVGKHQEDIKLSEDAGRHVVTESRSRLMLHYVFRLFFDTTNMHQQPAEIACHTGGMAGLIVRKPLS